MGLQTYIVLVFLPGFVVSQGIDQHKNFNLINEERCGIPKAAQRQIHHGAKATAGQFPWMVLITANMIEKLNESHSISSPITCTGTILNAKYILSVAHCFVVDPPYELHNIEFTIPEIGPITEPNKKKKVYHGEYVIRHPEYRTTYFFVNDIAIIRVKGTIEFSDTVGPICLEHGRLLEEDYTGVMASVAGFGVYDFKDVFSNNSLERNNPVIDNDLRYLPNFPIVDDEQCIDYIADCCQELVESINRSVLNSQICAGGEVEKFAYTGDSGGPLMVIQSENKGGAPRHGITRWGSPVFSKTATTLKYTYPNVFVRVRYYIEWILDNMEPAGWLSE
uniref:Seminal fluid protein n=1 Tax=Nilaparvata lugens TaxID=108931 RepID=A0A068F798_NILLU|nr:trypsin-1 [Nilaparvata lugens]APA33894.1 seminal fluid protein [Nilaparvata lugens]